MADFRTPSDQQSMSALVGGLIEDVQRLFRQELALAKREVQDEWEKAKRAGAYLGAAAVILNLASILLAFTLVKVLQTVIATEWVSYAIVGGAAAAIGGGFLFLGRSTIAAVRFVPPRTAQALENHIEAIAGVVGQDDNGRRESERLVRGGTP